MGVSPCHFGGTMHGRPGKRVHALLLMLVLALGTNLSFMQAGLMAGEMAISAECGHVGPSGCDGCGDGDGDVDASTCLSVCGSAAHGLLPGEPVALPPASRASFQADCFVMGGQTETPDHGPPKILILV